MSQYCEEIRAFTAGEALAAYRRVKLGGTDGEVIYSDADEAFIGVTEAAAADGASVAVRLVGWTTFKAVATAAIASHAAIYATADGKVDDAAPGSGSVSIGFALEAALAAGDIIECIMHY